MIIVVPRTWIRGVPRGYGNNKVAAEWLRAIENSLAAYREASALHDSLRTKYEVVLEFHLDPTSLADGRPPSDFRAHGTDLDNRVKQTLDGLSQTRSDTLPPGLRIVTDDKAIHRIIANKVIVDGEGGMGAWVEVRLLDEEIGLSAPCMKEAVESPQICTKGIPS